MAGDDRVLIFDTTLRDGEQSPGCSMTQPEKLRVAHALAELGVDVIEAGFPAASRGDFAAVEAIAAAVQGPVIAGLARCTRDDIDIAAKAIRPAARGRLHVFLATSAIHREFKLGMARDEIIRRAVQGVRWAREHCEDVEFSPEDASRTELDFLAEVVEAVIDAGATTINIPDTVGYTVPDEFGEVFRYLRQHVRGIDRARLSVHCHDDLGLAVANSLAAVANGARQVECTINGIGERAGNCALEEVVMALRTREAHYGCRTGIHTQRLYPTSRLLSSIIGVAVPRNKAIVGENAFAHESGIHQHGMLKNAQTYEIMRPEDVGLQRSNLVLGKHSGRHAFRERVRSLGFELGDAELNRVFEAFKALADRKKELFDGDIEALVLDAEGHEGGPWRLGSLACQSRSHAPATAEVVLQHADGRQVALECAGDGPVDAACKAVEAITGVAFKLRNFEVRAVSEGEDAQGEAVVDVDHAGRSHRGTAIHTNIVEGAVLALLEVVNRIELAQRNPLRQPAAAERDPQVRAAQTAV